MGKHRFIKPEPAHIRGICVNCNSNPQKKVGGKDKYIAICSYCSKKIYSTESSKEKERQRWRDRFQPYRKYLGDRCEKCGFVPEDECQLDIHHRDHDHDNNDLSNLATLCANCHRLEHRGFSFTKADCQQAEDPVLGMPFQIQ